MVVVEDSGSPLKISDSHKDVKCPKMHKTALKPTENYQTPNVKVWTQSQEMVKPES